VSADRIAAGQHLVEPADAAGGWAISHGHEAPSGGLLPELAGCRIEVSWALQEHPDKTEWRAVEARVIELHHDAMGN
jgi:hypothetical protein